MRLVSYLGWIVAPVLLFPPKLAASSIGSGDPNAPARVIVLLKSSPLSARLEGMKKTSAAIQVEKQGVEAARQSVIQTLKERGLIQEIHREFGYLLNGFAVTARERDRRAIAALREVAGVYDDQEVRVISEIRDREVAPPPGQPLMEYQGQALTGAGRTIAVIDTGVDYTHPDLGGCFGPGCKVKGGYDFFNNDPDPMDENGHGTHVCGIAAADGEIQGVAPKVSLLVYKVLGKAGGSANAVSLFLAALESAVDPDGNPATPDQPDVINLSLAVEGGPDSPIAMAVDRAVELGVPIVAAAGNEGPAYWSIIAPGNALKAITVGAPRIGYETVTNFGIADMKTRPSRGPVGDFLPKPDIVAPGQNIRSTIMGGGYASWSGTSMATPHAAGLVALLRQAHPDWNPETIKASLMNTAVTSLIDPLALGCGTVSVDRAVHTGFAVSPGTLGFGRITQVAGNWTSSKQLSITNLSSSSQTYRLLAEGVYQHRNVAPVPGVTVAVTAPSVTLGAGESSKITVTLTVDLDKAPFPVAWPFVYYALVRVKSVEQEISLPLVAGRVPAAAPSEKEALLKILAKTNAGKNDWTIIWEDHVVSLYLRKSGLTGPIPEEILQLTSLSYLELGNNSLTGGIPPWLADLPALEWLDIEKNQLTGPLPPQLGNMKSLQGLVLASNQLTGSIPPELNQLTNLECLDLAHNQLTGEIPYDLSQASRLVYLDLSGNQLTGPVPPQLGDVGELEVLDLEANRLTGPIPSELSDLDNLIELNLSWNGLTGVIPASLADLTNLEILNVAHNRLSGPIPTGILDLRKLRFLDLSFNHFYRARPRRSR